MESSPCPSILGPADRAIFIHVTQADYIDDYRIRVSFNDGTPGEIDLSAELDGEIFEPLKDKSFFKSFKIEGHTLSWSNGADFAPEFLRELLIYSVVPAV